jgi:O-antigen/teichoic acid export membrane protein
VTPDAAADSPGEASKQAPSTAGMTTKVVKGSLWTLAGQVAPLLVSLVTTPFVIRMLGTEGYGVLILVGLIPTYFAFAGFGMSMASTKFASEAFAKSDEEWEASVVRTAVWIALGSSVPVAAILLVFAGEVISLFNVPPDHMAEAVLALRLSAVAFIVNIFCGIYNTPQLVRLRMDLNTLNSAIPRIIGLVAVPILIYWGYGVVGAIAANLATSVLSLLLHVVSSGMLLPRLFGRGGASTQVKALLRYGVGIIATLIAAAFLINFEKIIVARYVTIEALAFYSVAFSLASMMTLFGRSLLQSLLPAFAQLLSPDSREVLQGLFIRTLRLSIFVMVPLFAVLVIVAKPFFTAWAGPVFGENSAGPFYILVVGLVFNYLAYIPQALLLAAGYSTTIAKLNWAELLPYLLIVTALTFFYGIIGAAIAWSLRVIVDSFLVIWLVRARVGVEWSHLNILKVLAMTVFPFVIPIILATTGSAGLIILIPLTLAATAGFAYILWFRLASEDERTFVGKYLSGFLAKVSFKPGT